MIAASVLRYRINDELTAAKVFDDEAIVINVVTGRYYDLEGAGALAWAMLTAGASASEVAAAMVASFDVDAATARSDVDGLVERLLAEELIVPAPDVPAPAAAPPAAAERAPYDAPALVTYTDMEDLLTVDPPLPAAYTPRP
jgi:hypothetical protein